MKRGYHLFEPTTSVSSLEYRTTNGPIVWTIQHGRKTGHSTFRLTDTVLALKILSCQELREPLRAITAIMS